MSDKLDAAIERFNEPTPAPEFKPMSDAYAEPEPKKQKEFGSDVDGLKKAAKDLEEQRSAADQKPIVEREYRHIGGPQDGEPVAPNETLDINRAARDLTRARNEEESITQESDNAVVQNVIDATRADVLQPQPPQPDQQQPPQVDVQQQQQSPEVQAQQQQQSAEDEARRALENPAIRQALESQVQQLETQRAQYSTAAEDSFTLARASLHAAFPELNGVTGEQLPAVLQVLAQRDPARAVALQGALQSTDRLYQASQQAKNAEAVVAAAKFEMYGREQDAEMDQYIAQQPKDEAREISRNLGRISKTYYGIDPQQLAQELRTNPALRSASFQKMLYQTAKTHLMQEQIAAQRVPPKVPPVMRPGVSSPPGAAEEADVASALQKFNKSPDLRSGAAYLNARRASRK